jgi:hypothetical protein
LARGANPTRGTPAAVFRSALADIQDSVQIPILLPATLPAVLRDPDINDARGTVSPDGYDIELRYGGVGGNVGFAAYFAGSAQVDHFDRGVRVNHVDAGERRLRLANGITAVFSPVSCGGSCSGPNLGWVQGGVVYTIQIRLPSDTKESEQVRIMLEAANAVVRVSRPTAGGPGR